MEEEKEKQTEVNAEVQGADETEKGGEKEENYYVDDYKSPVWKTMGLWVICITIVLLIAFYHPKNVIPYVPDKVIWGSVCLIIGALPCFYMNGFFSKKIRKERKIKTLPGILTILVGCIFIIEGKRAYPIVSWKIYVGIGIIILGLCLSAYGDYVTSNDFIKRKEKEKCQKKQGSK